MKKKYVFPTLLTALILSPASAIAGPYAPAVGQPGSTAINMNNPIISSWATGYTSYLPGANVSSTWQTPLKALGKAQGTSGDVVSLGTGGQITLTFNDPIANGTGADFAVFENSFNNTFLELAKVAVSSDGSNFFTFPTYSLTPSAVGAFGSIDPTNISGLAGKYRQGWGTPFDLNLLSGIPALDINHVSYVRLLDVVGNGSMKDTNGHPIYDPYPTTGSAGFDLDAIGVMNSRSTVVPLPAGLWLFISGMSLLGWFGKRKFFKIVEKTGD